MKVTNICKNGCPCIWKCWSCGYDTDMESGDSYESSE